MPQKPPIRPVSDYEPLTLARAARAGEATENDTEWAEWTTLAEQTQGDARKDAGAPPRREEDEHVQGAGVDGTHLRRGHGLAYAGLFLFTAVLYFRPYEYLPLPQTLAFWIAIATLLAFVPAQLGLEGNLTARPREVNLVLLFCVTGLLSIPLAASPGEAWDTFNDPLLKVVLMFIVMVNVVRTERRLLWLLLLALSVGVVLSVGAINDFRAGRLYVGGDRIQGIIGNLFGNPNDLALYLVTTIPLAVALLYASRNVLGKLVYLTGAVLMVVGVILSFSRGGFLALLGMGSMLLWKLGRRNRLAVVIAVVVFAGVLALAPGSYFDRIASIADSSRDSHGSMSARTDLLIRSAFIALHNPVFGVGMGNFHIVSIKEGVSHNAYTQVAAELGLAALVIYCLFMWTPLRRLREIERETFAERRGPRARFYYLSIGIQASLVGYMVGSFFASVAYLWYVYYIVGYSIGLRGVYYAARDDEKAARAADAGRAHSTWEDGPATPGADGLMPAAMAGRGTAGGAAV